MTKLQVTTCWWNSGMTVKLNNIGDVANELAVPVTVIMRWMSAELGVISLPDNISLRGKPISQLEIEQQLDLFIEKYVLCQKCKLPEIKMATNDEKSLIGICKSCGEMSKHDAIHRAGRNYRRLLKHEDKSKNG